MLIVMQRTVRRVLKKGNSLKDIRKVEVRHLNVDDYLGLHDSMVEAYKNWHGSVWSEENIRQLLEIFPEGQIVVLVNGKVVGCALSIIGKMPVMRKIFELFFQYYPNPAFRCIHNLFFTHNIQNMYSAAKIPYKFNEDIKSH